MLCFEPSLSYELREQRLAQILKCGQLADGDMERRITRLQAMFTAYFACSPFGVWAPGLHIVDEMRAITELYMPIRYIVSDIYRLRSLCMSVQFGTGVNLLARAVCWLDALYCLPATLRMGNPAQLLRLLTDSDDARRCFLFSQALPKQHGNVFGRYPGQRRFIATWLSDQYSRLQNGVRCLDVACGGGAGTYDLVELLLTVGYQPSSLLVHGGSLDPLEVFAAAHCHFPHDPDLEGTYRARVQPLFNAGAAGSMKFFPQNVLQLPESSAQYDVILCNGLVGGPLLAEPEKVSTALAGMANLLRRGGVLLLADRFHDGWKKRLRPELIMKMLCDLGLSPVAVQDGLGAIRPL